MNALLQEAQNNAGLIKKMQGCAQAVQQSKEERAFWVWSVLGEDRPFLPSDFSFMTCHHTQFFLSCWRALRVVSTSAVLSVVFAEPAGAAQQGGVLECSYLTFLLPRPPASTARLLSSMPVALLLL